MSELARALLKELNDDMSDEKSGGKVVRVQFNPETLKVTFANQIQTPSGGSGDQAQGSASRQYVGAGTTKLALTLWFDVSAATDDEHRVDDVRRLTQDVVYFMTPIQQDDPTKYVPPGVRFHWGSFKFDGTVDSMEETLEFFSKDGRPLRASVAMNLSQQKILKATFVGDGRVPGTRPMTAAPAGSSLQGLAAGAGRGGDWQSIAQANGIENPRRLEPGQLVNLNPTTLPDGSF
jgi:hypothetical protein